MEIETSERLNMTGNRIQGFNLQGHGEKSRLNGFAFELLDIASSKSSPHLHLAYEEELRHQMVLSVIGAGVGGALFLVTILILGVVTQMCHWRKTKTRAK